MKYIIIDANQLENLLNCMCQFDLRGHADGKIIWKAYMDARELLTKDPKIHALEAALWLIGCDDNRRKIGERPCEPHQVAQLLRSTLNAIQIEKEREGNLRSQTS